MGQFLAGVILHCKSHVHNLTYMILPSNQAFSASSILGCSVEGEGEGGGREVREGEGGYI